MTRGIIVLGMHRSGTSLIANLVRRWGAYVGEGGLIAADAWNPMGYWEYEPLVRFNMQLLRAVESRTSIPPDDGQRDKLAALAAAGEYRRRGLELLDGACAAGRPWVWKDPRLSILLPFWQRLWEDVCHVVAVRHPAQVARSMHRREDYLPEDAALVLWQRYMTEILKHTARHRATIFVSYNRLLSDAGSQCRRLCAFLDGQTSGKSRRATSARAAEMAGAVEPALFQNHDAERDIEETAGQRELYRILLELASGQAVDVPDVTAPKLAAGWREYLLQSASQCVDFSDQRT